MLIKLAEHAALYQYSLVNAQNHYIGFAQTETVWTHLHMRFIPSDAAQAILPTLSSCASTL
jgi:glucan 1,3-beta-glucosidase